MKIKIWINHYNPVRKIFIFWYSFYVQFKLI